MTKTFAHRKAAEEELEAFGFERLSSGRYCTDYTVAMIHPVPGTEKVRVSYTPQNDGI